MSNSNLKVNLYKQKDKHGSLFYVGKLKAPMNINCKDGICFIIFVSDDGNEEIQICQMENKPNDQY